MNSALDAHPRLRDDLKVVRREHEGETEFIVKEPDQKNYYRFDAPQMELMRLMNGQRTPEEIASAADAELGAALGPGQIADFAHRLKRLGLVERTPAEEHLMLMERLRKKRKLNTRGRVRGSLLRLRFSVGDPNQVFDEVVKRISWVWSPGFLAVSILLFLAYVGAVVLRWEEFVTGAAGLYTFSGYGAADWAFLWGIFVILGTIHELGHGLTTKYFGGDVHEIGAMLLYFSPALFCDTNDAWTFKRRSHRLWVTFAGPWIEFVVTGIAALVWVATEPGSFIHRVAFLAVLLGGVSSILSNANPLIPLDGYYALSDWLEIPNLRGRAFDYWSWLGKRYLLGIEVERPRTTPRERRVFLVYGGLALLYSALIAIVGLLWLTMILGRVIGPWVWVLVLVLGVRFLAAVRGRLSALVRTAVETVYARLRHRRKTFAGIAAGLLLLGLPFVLPWTYRASGPFQVEAIPRAEVRAGVDGILRQVHVKGGDTVRLGQALATLWNPDLLERLTTLEARTESLEVARRFAAAAGRRSDAASATQERHEVSEQLGILREEADRLQIRAPIRGVVLAHQLGEQVGERLAVGETLLRLAGLEGRVARVRLPLTEATNLAAGQTATMRLPARPNLEFQSSVRRVATMANGDSVEGVVPIPTADWAPPPGVVGKVKIITGHGTVAGALLRAIRQRIRLDLWL